MKFEKLVPNIFYADIANGLKLFVECLQFTILACGRCCHRTTTVYPEIH